MHARRSSTYGSRKKTDMDRKIEKKYWTPGKIFLVAAGAIVLVYLGYSFLKAKKSTLNADAEKMVISEVTEGTFDEYIPVTGAVQPLKTIRLDAIVGGYVTEKLVEGGTMVREGQTLLRLENQQLKLNFLQSETEASRLVNDLQSTRQRLKVERFEGRKLLSDLDFQIEQAKDWYDRNRKLFEDDVIPEQDFLRYKRDYEKLASQRVIELESQKYQEENAILQIKQLEGTLERTQKNVALWRQTLENLEVKAPVPGLLSSIEVEVGSNINQGQNIGQIDDLSGFRVRAAIDEYYISKVFTGLKGIFEFNGKEYPMHIQKVYPEVRSGRFEADLTFARDTPSEIKRGQTVSIRLELGQPSKALLLPAGGFFSSTGGAWVYVLDPNGLSASKRTILLGRKNPNFFEVLEGLQPGDRVITSSYDSFGEAEKLVLKQK